MKTATDAYPLPRMAYCIDSRGEARVFSTLDCNSGYWKIPVYHRDQDKTTSTTHCGIFRYKQMPFALVILPGKLGVERGRSAAFEKCQFPQALNQLGSFLRACFAP